MTTEQLAEYLGIQSSNISIQDNVFQVSHSIISKIDIAFWQQEFSVHFSECTFECEYGCVSSDGTKKATINVEMNFLECDFKQIIAFQRCIFRKNIAFFDCHAQEVNISECIFQKDFSFSQSDKYPQKQKPRIDNTLMLGLCSFQNISLKGLTLKNDFYCGVIEVFGKANFQFMTYEKKVTFEVRMVKNENNEIVKKGDQSVFKELVSFERTKFNDDVLLGECLFEDTVNFSHCEFRKDLSFCNSIFRNPLILYRSKIDKKLFLINSKWEFDFEKCLQSSKEQSFIGYQYSPRPQDQNAEICRNSFNTIKHILINNNNYLDASRHASYELYCKEIELDSKPQKTWRNKIDSLQLWFYRLTSDHHTDLAKFFNNVMMLIALFGIFTLGITLCKENYLHYEKQYFGRVMTSAIDLSIRKESHSLTKTTQCVKETQIPPKEALSILALCLSFVGIFIGFVALKDTKYKFISWCINISSYVIFLGILIYKPSLLLPFVGQLFGEGLKANFPAMQSLSVVYCILMFLMLFSLQKTARKNSIIPS